MAMKTAGYVRGGHREAGWFDAQTCVCWELAAAPSLTDPVIYADTHDSGRAELHRLLSDVQRGDIHAVIIPSFAVLPRRRRDRLHFIDSVRTVGRLYVVDCVRAVQKRYLRVGQP